VNIKYIFLYFTTNNSKTRTSGIKFFPTARQDKQQNIGCEVRDRVGYGLDSRLPLGFGLSFYTKLSPPALEPTQPSPEWIHIDASLGRSSRDVKLTTHVYAVSSLKIKESILPLPDTLSRTAQGVFLYPMT
jgi:hypothetical protein